MAVVFGVIAASILSGSILPNFDSMSTNTGFILFHHRLCVVATKLYGVVITSPVILNACKAVTNANVPFAKREMNGTPKNSANSFSNCLCMGPLLVNILLSHISLKYGINSSKSGNNGCVTYMGFSIPIYFLIVSFLILTLLQKCNL